MKHFSFLLLLGLLSLFTACEDDDMVVESNAINATFKANYDGQPFVIGETYTYEDGTPLFFTRLNFFISNISLVSADGSTVELSEIDVVDFTDQNIDLAGADSGYNVGFPSVLAGEYTGIKFGVGVANDLNTTSPTDYSSTHPLGNASDYWSAWNSYIFGKLEGKVDVNLDGTFTNGIVYHIGGNEYFKEVSFDAPITIDADNTSLPIINIDVKKLLVRSESDYLDIINNAAVHNDSDGILMNYVVDNFEQALEIQ